MKCPTCQGSGEVDGSWVKEAVVIYIRTGGSLPAFRIARTLKGLVRRNGWDHVRPRWEFYCELGRNINPDTGEIRQYPKSVSWLTPERFRNEYELWDPGEPQ